LGSERRTFPAADETRKSTRRKENPIFILQNSLARFAARADKGVASMKNQTPPDCLPSHT
jgi:hypothetical protein